MILRFEEIDYGVLHKKIAKDMERFQMEKDKRLNRYISMGSVFVSISTATGYFLDNVSPISYWGALDFLLWLTYIGILFLITRFLINIIVRKIAGIR